jgi:hypothetical protein
MWSCNPSTAKYLAEVLATGSSALKPEVLSAPRAILVRYGKLLVQNLGLMAALSPRRFLRYVGWLGKNPRRNLTRVSPALGGSDYEAAVHLAGRFQRNYEGLYANVRDVLPASRALAYLVT